MHIIFKNTNIQLKMPLPDFTATVEGYMHLFIYGLGLDIAVTEFTFIIGTR